MRGYPIIIIANGVVHSVTHGPSESIVDRYLKEGRDRRHAEGRETEVDREWQRQISRSS